MSKRGTLLVACYDLASCRAAIAGGADAISVLPNEYLKDCIFEGHLFDRDVFLTLEMNVRQDGLQNLLTLVNQAYGWGVKGIMVSDIGLYAALKERFDDLELIISSRFDIRNRAAVEQFLGDTIMLTPELSHDEASEIASSTSAGIVVHGNVGHLLDRSENLTLRSLKKKGLSFKDICLVDDMGMLKESGFAYYSIIDYHKSPSRIYTITSVYRSAIEGNLDEDQKNELLLTSDYNVLEGMGNRTDDAMNGYTKVKEGLLLGYVRDGKLILNYPLKRGERIAIPARRKRAHFKITYLLVDGKTAPEAHEGQSVVLKYPQFVDGQPVYKTSVEPREVPQRRIPVSLKVKGNVGDPLYVEAQAEGKTVVSQSEKPVEKADSETISQDRISYQLSRVGNSPFSVEGVELDLDNESFIQFSQLNRLRNQTFDALRNALCEKHLRKEKNVKRIPATKTASLGERPRIFVKVFSVDQVSEAIEAGADLLYFDIFSPEVMDVQYLCRKAQIPLYLSTPHIIHERERSHIQKLVEHYEPDGILAGNTALLGSSRNVHLDHTIPVGNVEAQNYWGVPSVVVPGNDGIAGLDPSRIILFKEGRMRFLQTRFSIHPAAIKKLRKGVRYDKNPYGDTVLYKEEQDISVDLSSTPVHAIYLELDRDVKGRITEYKATLQSSLQTH